MDALIGYTGFVGSNLLNQASFDEMYNSKNIDLIKGKQFKRIICAGAPAVKWKANQFPEDDWNSISSLINNLKYVQRSEEFILISTVDVYNNPTQINENTDIDLESLQPYGKHRYLLEKFVLENFSNVTIIRLPGLFGTGLKKNIIYDFLNNNNINEIDSRNIFQFYNLNRLYNDIMKSVDNNLKVVNFATEPVSVKEVAHYAFSLEFDNTVLKDFVKYDMQTIHSALFNGTRSYLASKQEVLEDIKKFIEKEKN